MVDKVFIENRNSQLLPLNSYSDDFLKNIFSDSITSKDLVFFEDRISTNLSNHWCLEKNEFKQLKEKYKTLDIGHSSSVFLEKCIQLNKDGLFFGYGNDRIEVCVVENQKVQLYNSVVPSSTKDLLYYVLLYRDQHGKDLEVYVNSDISSEYTTLLKDYISPIKTFVLPKMKLINQGEQKSFNLLQCV